MVCVLEFSLEL